MSKTMSALNAGSSSIKFGLFDMTGARPAYLFAGEISSTGHKPHLTVKDMQGRSVLDRNWPAPRKQADILNDILEWTDRAAGSGGLAAIGHRIVHGGLQFVAPVRLTGKTIFDELARLTPMAPLHQEACLSPARTLLSLRPDLMQVGCFDTAFHAALEPPASRFAIPRSYEESGVRRYGFHGLSHEFIAERLQEISPDLAGKRIVVAHLGSGASLCAMRDGRSVDTTMGFTPLDGVMDGTRCGMIDPGILSLPAARARHVGGRSRATVMSRVAVGRFRLLQRHAHATVEQQSARRRGDRPVASRSRQGCMRHGAHSGRGWIVSYSPAASANTPPKCAP